MCWYGTSNLLQFVADNVRVILAVRIPTIICISYALCLELLYLNPLQNRNGNQLKLHCLHYVAVAANVED